MLSVPFEIDGPPFSPPEAEEALVFLGTKRTKRTLANMRRAGTGPRYHRVGVRVVYPRRELFEWAQRQLGSLVSSTAEERALKAAAVKKDAKKAARAARNKSRQCGDTRAARDITQQLAQESARTGVTQV